VRARTPWASCSAPPSPATAGNPTWRASRTETFGAAATIDNWRWAGAFSHGKRLPKRASEISVHLKDAADLLQRQPPGAAD
jgi:glucose-6-phosphate 1-dehydrogenase